MIGNGYVRLIHDDLLTTYPGSPLEIINKGISGDRITDLAARWKTDVIDLNPDIVSISIGINDVWRQLDNPGLEQVYPDEFEKIYDDLLKQVKTHTNASLVLMDPTVIEENADSIGNKRLKKYIAGIDKLAKKYDAIIVLNHWGFLKFMEESNGYRLTTDGVHMNSTGNMLMANFWLETTRSIRLHVR